MRAFRLGLAGGGAEAGGGISAGGGILGEALVGGTSAGGGISPAGDRIGEVGPRGDGTRPGEGARPGEGTRPGESARSEAMEGARPVRVGRGSDEMSRSSTGCVLQILKKNGPSFPG